MRLCALVLLAFFTASPASAQKLDVATIKCGDFIKYNKETVGNLMVWLSAPLSATLSSSLTSARNAERQTILAGWGL